MTLSSKPFFRNRTRPKLEIVVVPGYGDIAPHKGQNHRESTFSHHVMAAAKQHGIHCQVEVLLDKNDGSLDPSHSLDKLRQILDQKPADTNIVLAGHSLGGLLVHRAAQLTTHQHIAQVISAVPPSVHPENYMYRELRREEIKREWEAAKQFTAANGMIFTKRLVNAIEEISKATINAPPLKCPLAIITSRDDRLTPWETVVGTYYAKQPASRVTLHVLKEGGHRFRKPNAGDTVKCIVSNTLKPLM